MVLTKINNFASKSANPYWHLTRLKTVPLLILIALALTESGVEAVCEKVYTLGTYTPCATLTDCSLAFTVPNVLETLQMTWFTDLQGEENEFIQISITDTFGGFIDDTAHNDFFSTVNKDDNQEISLGTAQFVSYDLWLSTTNSFPNALRLNTVDGSAPLEFGQASILATTPSESQTLVGPMTFMGWNFELNPLDTSQDKMIAGIQIKTDTCACIATTVQMNTIPDFSIMVDAVASITETLVVNFVPDTVWPGMAIPAGTCQGTFTVTQTTLSTSPVTVVDATQIMTIAAPPIADNNEIATVTITIATDATWYSSALVDTIGLLQTASTTQTFTLTVTNPCESVPITIGGGAALTDVSVAVGSGLSSSSTAYYTSTAQASYDPECAISYSINDETLPTWISYDSTDLTQNKIDVTPPDATTSVGTYYVTLSAYYTNYPTVQADDQYMTVTVTSMCSTVAITRAGSATTTVPDFYVYSTSVGQTIGVFGSTATTATPVDCAISFKFEADDDVPATVSITLTDNSPTDYDLSITSNNIVDVDSHTMTLTGYYTNYPGVQEHSEVISFNVIACDASSTTCACTEISLTDFSGLGTIDYEIPGADPGSDVILQALPTIQTSNSAAISSCTLTQMLQVYDTATQDFWDETITWLEVTTTDVQAIQADYVNWPTTTTSYTLRVVYELTDSMQDNRFVYDEFTLNFNTACYDYTLPTVTGTEVTDLTYSILPVSVSDTLLVTYTDDATTSCDDTPLTVNWYYQPQSGGEWIEFNCPGGLANCPSFISSTVQSGVAPSRLILDSSSWEYGDVYQGKTDFAFKIRYTISDPADSYVEWPFTITLFNPCYDDAPTRTSTALDVPFFVEADGTSSAVTSTANTVTWANTATVTDCTNTSVLQIKGSDNQWTDIGAGDISTYPWMSTTTGTVGGNLDLGEIVVQVEDIDANSAPYKTTPVTYELRWENNSPLSYHADATIYDYFEVTISYECATDTLTISTNIGIVPYQLNDSAAVNLFLPTQGVAGCAYTMVCEQNDPTNVGWEGIANPPITTCDTTTGISVAFSTGDAGIDDVRPTATIEYRVIFTSTFSTVGDASGRIASDYFEVVYTDPCYGMTITLTTGVSDVTYLIHSTNGVIPMAITAPTFSATSTCAVTDTIYAKLSSADEDAWEDITDVGGVDYTIIGFTNANTALQLDILQSVETGYETPVVYDIKIVKASTDTLEFTSEAEARFQVTMVDACYYNELSCDEVAEITFTINADNSSPGAHLQPVLVCIQSAVDNAGAGITCPLTQTLETQNAATFAWEANTGHTKPTGSTNICTYGVADCQYEFDDNNMGGTYDVLQPTISKRWQVTDPRSQSNLNTVYLPFDQTILWACYTDDVAITSGGISTWEYQMGAGAETKSITLTTDNSHACPMTTACEEFDDSLGIWSAAADPPISGCITAGIVAGSADIEVTVAASTVAYQPEKTVDIRVSFTATYSTSEGRIAYDLFDIHIYDECVSSNPVVVSGVADDTYSVAASNAVAVDYTPDFDPDAITCPYTATIMAKLDGTADDQYQLVGTSGTLDLTFMTQTATYTLSVLDTAFANYPDPVVYEIWYNYVITDDTTSSIIGEADTYFLLTLQDECYANVPSVSATSDDLTFIIDVQDANHGLAIVSDIYTVTSPVAGCTIATTLEIFDDATDTWIEYDDSGTGTDNSANYAWISAYSTSQISVLATNAMTEYHGVLETIYNLRWKSTDSRSKASDATIYDYFDVSISWLCSSNTVSLGNGGIGIADDSYELGSGDKNIAASFDELHGVSLVDSSDICPTDVSIECAWQDTDENWVTGPSFITLCDITGGITINLAEGADLTFEPERYVNLRTKYTVPDSLLADDAGRVVYDFISVRFYHKCADLEVNLGDNIPDTTVLVTPDSITLVPTFTLANDNTCSVDVTYAVREYGTATWYAITDVAPINFNEFLTASGTFAIDISSATPATFNPALVFEIEITYSASTTIAIDAYNSDTFLLTMKDYCIENVVVCTGADDFTHTIPAALTPTETASTVSTCTFEVNSVDSTALCAADVTDALEIHDDLTDTWVEYTGTGQAWIKSSTFLASNRIVTVDTVDNVTYQSPVTYNLRWKSTDARSGLTVYDAFDITIQYGCTADTVALTNSGTGLDSFTYTIGDLTGATDSLHTTTHASGCPLTMECEQFDDVSQAWITAVDPFIETCSIAGGIVVQLETTDGIVSNYQPEGTVQMRIVYTSTSSTLQDADGRVAIDYFDLTIVEACYQLDIELTAGFSDIDYRVHAASAAEINVATFGITNDSGCTITQTTQIKLQNAPDTDYQDITATTPTDYTGWLTPSGTYGVQVLNTAVVDWATPTLYDVWINVAGDPAVANSASADFYFTLLMSQACSYNTISCTPSVLTDFEYEIPADPTTATSLPVTSASTCTSSVTLLPSGSCTLTQTLEIFDSVNNEWELYDSGATSQTDWPFVDFGTFDSANRVLEINTDDIVLYNEPITFNFRWVVTDLLSTMSSGVTVYQTFDVTINYICYDDEIVLNNAAADSGQLQAVDGIAAQAIPSSYVSNTASCPWTVALYVYNDSTFAYVAAASHPDAALFAIDTATGIVTVGVDSANVLGGGVVVGSQGATFISFTLNFRVEYTSTSSTVTSGVQQDDYDVTYVNSCYDNSFTLDTPSAIDLDYVVDAAGATQQRSPLFTATGDSTCARTCTVEIFDEDVAYPGQWNAYNAGTGPFLLTDKYTSHPWITSVSTDGTCTIDIAIDNTSSFWTVSLVEIATTFQVKITVQDDNSINADNSVTATFDVTLTHQCAANVLTLTTPTTNLPNFLIPATGTATNAFAGHTIGSTFTAVDPTCDFTTQLQIYDDSTNVWSDYVAEPYVTLYNIADGSWTLSAASTDGIIYSPSTQSEPTTITLRYVIGDQNSATSSGTVYDQFYITFNYECSDDSVTIDSSLEIGTVEFIIDVDPDNAIASSVVHLKSDCDMTVALNYFDTSTEIWTTYVGSSFDPDPVKAFDTTTGQVTIGSDTTTYASYAPYSTFQLQVVYTSTHVKTQDPDRTASDQFTVVLKASCYGNTLALTTPRPNEEYFIGQGDLDIEIYYTSSIATTACPLDAKLYVLNDSTQAFDAYIGNEASYPYVTTGTLLTTNTGALLDAGWFTILQATKTTDYQPEKTITFKVVITDLAANDPDAIAIEDEWDVTIYDKCARNELVLTTGSIHSDVTHTIEADGASPATSITEIVFTSTEDNTECTFNRGLDIYDSSTETWITYAGNESTYPWVDQGSIDVNYNFDIVTENFTIDPIVYQLRLWVEDPDSFTTSTILYDYFDVTIRYQCNDDVLSLAVPTDYTLQQYQLDSGAQTIASNVAQTIALCQIVSTAQIFDTNTQSYVDLSTMGFITSTTDGNIVVDQASHADYIPFAEFQIRVTYESTYSQQSESERIVSDDFILRIGDVCQANELLKTAELDDLVHIIQSPNTADTQTPLFTQDLASGTCPLTCTLEFFDDLTNTWQDKSAGQAAPDEQIFDTSTGIFSVLYTDPTSYKPFEDHFVRITIVDENSVSTIATLEWTFTLQLRDQCADDTITLDTQISPFDYILGSGASPTKTPIVTHLYATCTINFDLYYFDEAEDIWVVDNVQTTLDFATFNTATGDLVVESTNTAYSIETIFSLKIVITIPDSIMTDDLIEQEDRFKVTIKDACADNTLSILEANDLLEQTYYIADPAHTITPVVTTTVPTATCPLTVTLDYFDESMAQWRAYDYSIVTNPTTFVTSFVAVDTGVLTIETSDTTTYDPDNDTWTELNMRITFTDPNSDETDNTVSDTFKVILKNHCTENELTLSGDLTNELYYVDDTAIGPFTLPFSVTVGTCTITHSLYFFDDETQEWTVWSSGAHPFAQWTASSGELVVSTSDYAYGNEYEVLVRLYAEDEFSEPTNSIYNQFKLTIKDKCRDIVLLDDITGFSGTESVPYQYDMWEPQSVAFTAITYALSSAPTVALTWSGNSLCPVTYHITDIDYARSENFASTYTITPNDGTDGAQSVDGIWTDDPKLGFFYIRAVVKNIPDPATSEIIEVLTTEVKYYVNIVNPCIVTNSINVPTAITDIDYTVKATAETRNVSPWTDIATVNWGNQNGQPDHLCGQKTYGVYLDDQVTEINSSDQPFLTITGSPPTTDLVLQVQTIDPVYYTNADVTYYIKATLDDYLVLYETEATQWIPFIVNIFNCQVTGYSFPTFTDPIYNVYTPIYWIEMTAFTEVGTSCGWPITYTVKWKDFYETELPLTDTNFVEWNEPDFRFEVQTDDVTHITGDRQIYNIQLIGSVAIADMNPIYEETHEFQLIVNHGCELDQITNIGDPVTNAIINDYIYYINEETETPGFTQGSTIPFTKQWTTAWTQTVEGCPVVYVIYRTEDGTQRALTAAESAVVFLDEIQEIDTTLTWIEQTTGAVISILDFDARVNVVNIDYSLDLESWDLNIAMESEHSTDSQRVASDDFNLQLKDVCWDLPRSAPVATSNFVLDLYSTHQLTFTGMTFTTSTWIDDYCAGFTYSVEYVTGPLYTGAIGETLPDFAAVYTHTLDTLYVEGLPTDSTWVGTHTLKFIGTVGQAGADGNGRGVDGLYDSEDSATFTLTLDDPCLTTTVNTVVITDMSIKVGDTTSVTQDYTDPTDTASFLYGDGYDKCGNRAHYIADANGSNPTLVHQSYQLRNGLNFKISDMTTTPYTYELKLAGEDQAFIGTYNLMLIIELEDYPSSTYTAYTRAEIPFVVEIQPCTVSSFEASVIPSQTEFQIGNSQKTTEFTFVQSPCTYTETYSILQSNGDAAPDFITILTDSPYFYVYTTDDDHVGNYTFTITSTLQDFKDLVDDSTSLISTADRTSAIYSNTFDIDIEISEADFDYEDSDNTKPFILPPPADFQLYAGEEMFYALGNPIDAEINNQTIRISVDLGNAAQFARYEDVSNTIEIGQGATDGTDVGYYDISIRVYDNFDEIEEDDKDEDEDCDPDEDANCDTERVAGETWYNITIAVLKVYEVGDIVVDPLVQEIFYRYNGQVWDVSNITKDIVYNNTAGDDLGIEKITLEDYARDEDQPPFVQIVTLLPETNQQDVGEVLAIRAPQPTIKLLTNDGLLIITFDQAITIPEQYKELVEESEVALRWTQSRTETYLTDQGYRDFEIRPALDLQIAASPDSNPELLSFTWEIVEYAESQVTIQLLFDNPAALSSKGEGLTDRLQITFWGNSLFVGQNGLSIQNGITLKEEVIRQISPRDSASIKEFATGMGYVVLISLIIWLNIAIYLRADTYPVWSLVNMLWFVTHLPLLNLQLPGGISIFMNQFTNVLRLDELDIDAALYWSGLTSLYSTDNINDRGHTLYFEQLGYTSRFAVRNLAILAVLLAVQVVLIGIAGLFELNAMRDVTGRMRLDIQMSNPSYAKNGRVKSFRATWFQALVSCFIRTLITAFAEIYIFVVVDLTQIRGDSQLAFVSKILAYVLTAVIIVILFSVSVYRMHLYKLERNDRQVHHSEEQFVEQDDQRQTKKRQLARLQRAMEPKKKDFLVLWPGVETFYLGMSQQRMKDVDTYIAWFFVRRILFGLIILLLPNYIYFQILANLTLSLGTMIVALDTRPFMYFHNFALEMLNESFVFLCCMASYIFTPFVVDPQWRVYGAYFIIIQMIIIIGANEMLMWHSVIWQVFWKMEQDEKASEAIIMRSKTQLNQLKMLKGVKRVNATQEMLPTIQETIEIENTQDILLTQGINSVLNTQNDLMQPGVLALTDLEKLAGMNADVLDSELMDSQSINSSKRSELEMSYSAEAKTGVHLTRYGQAYNKDLEVIDSDQQYPRTTNPIRVQTFEELESEAFEEDEVDEGNQFDVYLKQWKNKLNNSIEKASVDQDSISQEQPQQIDQNWDGSPRTRAFNLKVKQQPSQMLASDGMYQAGRLERSQRMEMERAKNVFNQNIQYEENSSQSSQDYNVISKYQRKQTNLGKLKLKQPALTPNDRDLSDLL